MMDEGQTIMQEQGVNKTLDFQKLMLHLKVKLKWIGNIHSNQSIRVYRKKVGEGRKVEGGNAS